MASYDFAALENIEFQAGIDLYRAAPEDVRLAHAIEVRDTGATTCLTCRGIEPAAVFRRAVGLGVGLATNESGLESVLTYMNGLGSRYAIPIAPQSQPSTLPSWLEQRGFTLGYAWMKFCRPCEGAPQTSSDLEIRVIGREHGGEFGRVVAEGFGLSAAVAPWVGALAGRANWVCVMAFAGAGRWKDADEMARKAQALRAELALEAILVTRSEEGMSLYTAAGAEDIPAVAREVYDVSGAGDTVIATLGVLLAAGADLAAAVRIANEAAGVVVGKLGTAVATPDELA